MTKVIRDIPPCPPGFAERFILDGWRGVERVYGASTPLLLKWIEASGGEELHRRRRERIRPNAVMPQRRTA